MVRLSRLSAMAFLPILLTFTSCAGQADSAGADESDVPVAAATATTSETVLRDGEDWPMFLGPRQNGVSAETGLLAEWPAEGPPIVWNREVGTGYSAPSVRNNRLVLHHRVGSDEIVECFRADDGEPLWKYAYESNFRDPYGYNNGPRCSPLLTESYCYTFGAEGKLLCLTLDSGDEVWSRDLKGPDSEFNIPEAFFGVGATPILEGDKLIVAVGGQPNSGLVAFNAANGATLWQSVGKSTWDGAEIDESGRTYGWRGREMVVSYSSPLAATINDRRHVLCLMRQGLVSVDPQTGEENFHYWFRSRDYESVNAARPVVVDDGIMISAAYQVGAAQLKVAPDGKSVETVWRDPGNLMTHWSTAIHVDGYYYGFSGRHDYEATMRCIDARTGEIVWQTTGSTRNPDEFEPVYEGLYVDHSRVRDPRTDQIIPTPFYGRGSAILTEGRFIVLSEYGTLALLNVSPERWEEISRFKVPRMHYPSWAAPVLSRGYLYLRCEDALVCLDLKPPAPGAP